MKAVLSPKELASAMGVSESSLKRWVDEGRLRASRTAGGHRRIPIIEAIRFVRETHTELSDPTILGLVDVDAARQDPTAVEDDDERMFLLLREGRSREARGTVVGWYLSGRSVAEIFDGPVRSAMQRLGDLWQHSPSGIFFEHRATDICIQAVSQLRSLLPSAPSAVLALGGAPAGDPYILPSIMAATVFEAEGFRAMNLGPNTPAAAMIEAVDHHHPLIVWMSATASKLPENAAEESVWLAREVHQRGAQLLVGGQMRHTVSAALPPTVYLASTMSELAAFARGVLASSTKAVAGN